MHVNSTESEQQNCSSSVQKFVGRLKISPFERELFTCSFGLHKSLLLTMAECSRVYLPSKSQHRQTPREAQPCTSARSLTRQIDEQAALRGFDTHAHAMDVLFHERLFTAFA